MRAQDVAATDEEQTRLQVSIPASTAKRLIENGHLCAADLRCLDLDSKRQLQRLCLEACAHCMRCIRRDAVPLYRLLPLSASPRATRDKGRGGGTDTP